MPAAPLRLAQAPDAATAASPPGSNKTYRFPTPLVQLAMDLVCTAGVSLRGTPRVLDVVQRALGLHWHIPHWTSVRNWLLRAGLARWRKGLRQADDWLVLADHSVQIGTEKCLVGLGIRQADYQRLPGALTLEDMTLLQLEVMPRSTKALVAASLQQLSQTVGVPSGVTHDNAADLAGGARLLKKQHHQVRSVVDCKHKAACLLKKRLHKDCRWQEFQKQMGQSKAQIQQTELAFLAPPSQRSKARYMNVDKLVVWAEKVLAVLDGKLALGAQIKLSPERLQEKLGWLKGYRDELLKWSQWLRTIEVVVGYVGWHGLSGTTAQRLTEQLGSSSQTALGQELISFVREQSSALKEGERIPGSTEVVESCMGKLKKLTGEHSKGGFTGLLLALGAVVGPKSGLEVADLFAQVSTKDVRAWIKTHLGHTVQSARRRLALAFRSAQQKRLSPKLALP